MGSGIKNVICWGNLDSLPGLVSSSGFDFTPQVGDVRCLDWADVT